MATAAKKVAVKPAAKTPPKKPGTALTLWEQEMAEAAVSQGSKEKNTGGAKAISVRGGVLSVDGNEIDGNELRVIVLASVYENMMYGGDFDPDTPTSPVCYAFSEDGGDDMAPHAEAPEKVNDTCLGCPNNEWGSADKGRGKACKNVRRLMLITEDALEDGASIKDAEMRILKLPVTSVKNWTNYVKSTLAEDVKRPSWGVVTTIKVKNDAKTQFKVNFEFEELIEFNDETFAALKKKVKEAESNIASAYPVFEEEEKPAKGRKVIPIKNQRVAAKPAAKAAVKGKGKY
jgi:hypothetical protein